MYDYLIGCGVLGALWAPFYILRKDLRKLMLWSGLYYIIVLSVGFLLLYLLHIAPEYHINPGYWSPPSLFDLNNRTQGYGIEDALFMFFVAGVTTALYKTFARQKVDPKRDETLKKPHAMWVGIVLAAVACIVFRLNEMYLLILFNLFSGLIVLWYRRDLIRQALYSGLLFLIFYGILFQLFIVLFPDFILNHYHIQHTSGVFLLRLPIEEYLYAFTFGLLWGPLYEYKHKLKTVPLAAKN